MRGSKRSRGRGYARPADASIVVSSCGFHVSDGSKQSQVPSSAVQRSQLLTRAERDAVEAGCRVPTSFPAEQIELWAAYTRMPRVFNTQASLLSILSVLEVADMLHDPASVASMCNALALEYLAPLAPACEPHTDAAAAPKRTPRGEKLKPRCKHPQPRLAVSHAFLWGAGPSSEAELGGVGPAEAPPCCAAAARAKHASAALDRPQDKPGTVFTALEALPEHLLLRVLRAWAAPLPTQLATLPRRMHAAVITAAHPSVDSGRSVSLGSLDPQPFRRALRAVAALASMRRVDTVTLPPPRHSDNNPQTSTRMGPMQLVARRLRPLSAITSLHLLGMPRCWLGSNAMRRLSCIASMPHLRAVGVARVKHSLVPALVDTLACMPHLHDLHLGVRLMPLVVDGAWAGAGLVTGLTALSALEAVNLNLEYKHVRFRGDVGAVERVAPLLHALDEKRIDCLEEHFFWEGKRRPDDVLGALRAVATQLKPARCIVEEQGSGSFELLPAAAIEALWGALMSAPAHAPDSSVVVETLYAGVSHSMRRNTGTAAVDVPPATLGNLSGLLYLELHEPEEGAIDGAAAVALGNQLYKLTQLMSLECREATLDRAAAQLLLPRLSALLALQELMLEGCCIGPDGGEALAAGLPRLSALQHLDLGLNDLGERGGAAVVDALAPAAAAGLTWLDLAWNSIGLGGAAALAARLPGMTSLKQLHLSANRIMGGEGVEALLGGLAAQGVRLTALETLTLQRSFLECAGASALAAALPSLPNLACLDLQANAIGNVGMRALVRRLGHMPRWDRLDMAFNCVGDAGAQALAHMLRKSVRVRGASEPFVQYNLEHNGVGDIGAIALAEALLGAVGRGVSGVAVALRSNEISAGVWHDISRRSAHANRRGHRLCLCAGRYCRSRISPGDLLEMMAG